MVHRAAVIFAFVICLASPLFAHPGVGIVKDPKGFVFYTDLTQIWQIDPSGHRSVAVPNVHTHELAIDGEGNLIGEEVRGANGGWQHRIWRRTPDGRLTDIVPWTDGFWQNKGLVRDAAGNDYWLVCPDHRCQIRKQDSAGHIVTIADEKQFHNQINWLAVDSDSSIYFSDGPDLRRIDKEGQITTIAAALGPPGNSNALMGLRLGADGSIYVAVPSRGAILRVGRKGNVTVAARCPEPWQPSGVLMDRDGSIWILEFNAENKMQVRRIRRNGVAKIY